MIIGLTGGIGSGKSTVSSYLEEKGYQVIDADKIARKLVEKGAPLLEEIRQAFGEEMMFEDGSLNRGKLGTVVFSDEKQKEKLDMLMREGIFSEIESKVVAYKTGKYGKHIFIDAPLLFESGLNEKTEEIWVVDAEDELRISRVIARDGLSAKEVEARIKNQMSREEKNKMATHVIDNSGNLEQLLLEVDKLLEKLS